MTAESTKHIDLGQLKTRHDEIYRKAVEVYVPMGIKGSDASATVDEEIDPLLNDLEQASLTTRSMDDYKWLTEAAEKWQIVLTALNVPRPVRISLPLQSLDPPNSPKDYMLEKDIHSWIQKRAFWISQERLSERARNLLEYMREPEHLQQLAARPEVIYEILGHPDKKADDVENWCSANVHFAHEVLAGRIDFVRRIAPGSYWRLEQQWLEEVKQLLAYSRWRDRGGGWGEWEKKEDFYWAVGNILRALNDPTAKASHMDFVGVRRYIEENYFEEGRFAVEKPSTKKMIARKARRLHEFGAGTSELGNWYNAVSYAKGFYEAVIPAVENADYELATQIYRLMSSPAGRRVNSAMVNVFEAVLFKYFVLYSPGQSG